MNKKITIEDESHILVHQMWREYSQYMISFDQKGGNSHGMATKNESGYELYGRESYRGD
jgi:hypothetical protein